MKDSEDWWITSSKTATGTTHKVTGLACGTSYEFRVGAYGDGSSVNDRAGLWSETASATMGVCSPYGPPSVSCPSAEAGGGAAAGQVQGTAGVGITAAISSTLALGTCSDVTLRMSGSSDLTRP